MTLTKAELKSCIHGAYRFADEEGYLAFYKTTQEVLAYYKTVNEAWYVRGLHTASETAEFDTDASAFSFDYRLTEVCSLDTVDLYVDGRAWEMKPVADLTETGHLTFALPAGKKRVCLYFPCDAKMSVKNWNIEGSFAPVKNPPLSLLWIGDSITQGYGPLITSHTFVNVLNRSLGANLLSYGIGGLAFDAGTVLPIPGYTPDKIVVTLGTNGHQNAGYPEKIVAYFDALTALYPKTPILAVTPVWRCDQHYVPDNMEETRQTILSMGERHPNITPLDGWYLIPHCPQYLHDGLHPNALGSMLYAENLLAAARKIGFFES